MMIKFVKRNKIGVGLAAVLAVTLVGGTAARITGRDAHWLAAVSAAQGLERYLTTRLPGLWRDRMTPTGAFQVGPAPAGNLYHIVAAIRAFTEALQPDAPPPGFGS